MLKTSNPDPGRPTRYSRRRGQRGDSGSAPWPYTPDQSCQPPASLPDGRPWPKVSIVVPLVDSESDFEENILSVLHQEYPQVELIIIGHSQWERTPRLIEEYQQYSVYDVCEPGCGPGAALNKGMKIAGGDLLTWLGGDDYLAPGALHAMALAQAQVEADIIAGACQLHNKGSPTQQHVTAYAMGSLRLDELVDFERFWLPNPFLFQPGMMFTRDIWQRAGAYVSGDCATALSYDLWLRFAELHARLHVIGRPVVWSRIETAQTMAELNGDDSALAKVRDAFVRRHSLDWKKRSPQQVTSGKRWVLVNDRAFKYGAGIAHQNTAEILRRAGHHVNLVATEQIPQGDCKTAYLNDVIDSIERHAPEVVLVGNLHGSAHGTEVLETICQRFETVAVLHDFWLLTGRCIYPGGSRRYIEGCDATCDCPYDSPDTFGRSISSAWQRKRECLRSAERLSLFTTSQWMSEKVRQALAVRGAQGATGKGLCHWLKCGLELHQFQPRDKKLCRELLGLPQDRFIILTSGDSLTDPRKGLQHLTSALEQLQLEDVLVVALGWFQDNEELPIANIRAMGYIHNRTELAILFAAADVFVGASLDEVFGQVFVEAAASGTPSVGYPIGGIPEALVHGVTGLLTTDVGPSYLADRINELYRDPAYRSDLGRWARMHVENEWSYVAAYYQLVQGLRDAGVAQRVHLSSRIALQTNFQEQKALSHSTGLLGELCNSSGTGN